MRNLMITTAVRAAVDALGQGDGGITATALETEALTADAPETEEAIQERKARLLASQAQAEKVAGDGTAVPAKVIEMAKAEIRVCWEEWSGQGGVYDLQKQVKRKVANIAQHILAIAKACAAETYARAEAQPDLDVSMVSSAMFRNAMAMAELDLRGNLDLTQPDAEDKLDTFLKGSWSIYRGQIRTGMEAGFDPRDHESIYSITEAVKQSKAAKSTGTRNDSKGDQAQGGAATQTNEQQAQGVPTEVSEAAKKLAEESAKARGQEKDSESVGLDWSQLEAICQLNGKVQAALILLHRSIHAVDLRAENNEERVINSLNLCARQINGLTRREVQEEMAELDEEIGATAAGSEETPIAAAVREQLESDEPEAIEA